jgi:hypothetical protein
LQQPTKGWQLIQVVGHRTGASKLVSTVAVDRYGFDGSWLASSGARGVCRFIPYFAFTRPSEYSIHPTLQDTSPDALRSPARQNPLRYHLLMHTLTCVILVLPFPGVHRCEAAATRSRRRLASSHRVLLALPPRVARAARTARCARRVSRCSPRTRPCESRPRARSLATCSAAHWPCWLPRPRSGLPGSQARPPSICREPSAVRHARPCDCARPARRRDLAHVAG